MPDIKEAEAEALRSLPILTPEEERSILRIICQGSTRPFDRYWAARNTWAQNIEWTGMPGTRKTTLLNSNNRRLNSLGIPTTLLEEQKVHFGKLDDPIAYNLAMAYKACNALVEGNIGVGNARTWMDRGIFNAIPFLQLAIDEGWIKRRNAKAAMENLTLNFSAYVDVLIICDATEEASLETDMIREHVGEKTNIINNMHALARLRQHFLDLPQTLNGLRDPVIKTPLIIGILDSSLGFDVYSDLFSRTINTLLSFELLE